MSNLEKINVPENIHLNIDETYDFIKRNLPARYAAEVFDLLPKEMQKDRKTMMSYIRQVKKHKRNSPIILRTLWRISKYAELTRENN